MAVTGRSPSQLYRELTERYGDPAYARIDTAATREQKAKLGKLSPEQVTAGGVRSARTGAKCIGQNPVSESPPAAPGNAR